MIPVLYEQSETDFTTYGIGVLIDVMECRVVEERNNLYEMEMQYPITGLHYSQIIADRIIKAIPSEDAEPQLFKIYAITKPMDGIVTVNCEHISYRLRHTPVQPYSAASASEAMAGIKTYSLVSNPFTFWTNVTTQSALNIKEPRSARAVLGGVEGSILDQFGGEYEFDNYNVKLWASRGEDNGVTLRYGKNITDINQEESLENTVTGILPYWKNDTTVVIGDITKVNTSYSYDRIETTDVTSELTSEEADYVPTKAEVTAAGAKVLNERSYLGIPSNNIKVSFVALWQTEEYKNVAALEKVHLCDTVTVIYERLGIQRKAKVIKTDFDVIKERYNEIEIGDFRGNLSSTIVTQQQQIAEQQAQLEEQAQKIGTTESRIDKTNDRITLEVKTLKDADAELHGRIDITDSNISLEVLNRQNADNAMSSRIDMTDSSITAEVAARKQGDIDAISQIDVKINKIQLKVQNGEKSSLLTLTAGDTVLASENIQFSGTVTFSDLYTSGNTIISGDNIKTGTITAINMNSCNMTAAVIDATSKLYAVMNNPYTGEQTVEVGSALNTLYINLGALDAREDARDQSYVTRIGNLEARVTALENKS